LKRMPEILSYLHLSIYDHKWSIRNI